MELDEDKIDEVVLALLALGRHDGCRVWKSFDWQAMSRLHAKGYISQPDGRAKSVLLTDKGDREAQNLLARHFGKATS